MPLIKNLLQKAQDKLDNATREQQQQRQQQQQQQHNQPYAQQPPPIPHGSKPPSQLHQPPTNNTCYWRPDFSPHIPVSQYFHHETGQTGWGNNEAQNYTSDPANSFHTSVNANSTALVVRAMAASHAPTREQQYTSARLISHQRLGRPRGYLSIRLSAPVARGIWPAVWLLPAQPSTWPSDGEIDIFEAWNGDPVNHSCLHWGDYSGSQNDRHRVKEVYVPGMTFRESPGGKEYGFAWVQEELAGSDRGRKGRAVWYIDGKPVMKGKVPDSTKRLSEWQIIVNVAMGGDVNKGRLPDDGVYDLLLHEIGLWDAPPRGWDGFERDYKKTEEGHTM